MIVFDYDRIPGKTVYEPAWVEKYTGKQEERIIDSFIGEERIKKEIHVLDSLCEEDSKMLQYLYHEGCLKEEVTTNKEVRYLFKIGRVEVAFLFRDSDWRANITIKRKYYHTLKELIDEVDRNHWLYKIL